MGADRILLVEDEESLRLLLDKYLVRLGYEVNSVSSAEEAWELFQSHREAHSLLLVDLTLPGMPGDVLMRRVLEASSSIRVLLSSGYPYSFDALAANLRPRADFLQKPYLPRQLAERIKSMIQTAPATVQNL